MTGCEILVRKDLRVDGMDPTLLPCGQNCIHFESMVPCHEIDVNNILQGKLLILVLKKCDTAFLPFPLKQSEHSNIKWLEAMGYVRRKAKKMGAMF